MDRRVYVRIKLAEFGLSQVWLGARLAEIGVNADATEISKALSGALNTPKAREIVTRAVEVVNDYEARKTI